MSDDELIHRATAIKGDFDTSLLTKDDYGKFNFFFVFIALVECISINQN